MSEAVNYFEVTALAYTGRADRFTYHSDQSYGAGQIVTIPLGNRERFGVVLAQVNTPTFKTKAITGHVPSSKLPAYLIELALWISQYYASSLASVFTTILPSGIGRVRRDKPSRILVATGLPPNVLTHEQQNALLAIRASSNRTHLVHGVTGSGKTRLYMELAAESLSKQKSVIILVPEITLTPQLVGQFEHAFGSIVLATHSKLTEAERHRIWSTASAALDANEPRIIIGPRSSLFLPIYDLGLIVVDECHETSYKQEQHPRYHAVTVAGRLSQMTGARLILGSATPGLNELDLAISGRINYVRLVERANAMALPKATIIDLRNKDLLRVSKFITQPLIDLVTAALAEQRQSLLYLNRRGSASSQVCGDCGNATICPNCNLPLTFHADLMRLICHHCNYRRPTPAICSVCQGSDLKLLGGGTKRIEAEVQRLWPSARVARLDRDSATLSHIKAVYRGLKTGDIDIVIGTQMIAKGLDLPAIDVVGVISADTMLQLPDYTASERTFQLLTQVSGRAGRGDRPGQVIIQTYSPDHPTIRAASKHDYDSFAALELEERRRLQYPPSAYLLKLEISGESQDKVVANAQAYAAVLRQLPGVAVAGPAPAFLPQQSGKFYWLLSIKSAERSRLVAIAQTLPSDKWIADLDPINLL
jgi:primosomal protein N' (replication factor Y)